MSLLDPAFVARLDRLRLRARRRVAGGAMGRHAAARRGLSPEVAEHRPYGHGDDPRQIDWNAYARLDELVVRLAVAEDELAVHLLLDASASLGVGAPTKLEVAKRLLAAVGHVALGGGDRVALGVFSGGGAATPHRAVHHPPGRGRARTGRLLRALEPVTASGDTSLARAVDAFLARRPRPGLVVLASDLLDPGGFARPLDRLLAARHGLWLLHVLGDLDWEPPEGDDVVLVDAEHGARVALTLDAAGRRAYREARDAFLREIDGWARRRGVPVLRVVGGEPVDERLLAFVRSS